MRRCGFLAAACLWLLACGCSTTVRCYPGRPLPPEQVAVLQAGASIRLLDIDRCYWPDALDRVVEILPRPHQVTVVFDEGWRRSGRPYTVDFEAMKGRTYRIDYVEYYSDGTNIFSPAEMREKLSEGFTNALDVAAYLGLVVGTNAQAKAATQAALKAKALTVSALTPVDRPVGYDPAKTLTTSLAAAQRKVVVRRTAWELLMLSSSWLPCVVNPAGGQLVVERNGAVARFKNEVATFCSPQPAREAARLGQRDPVIVAIENIRAELSRRTEEK
jgi:hypothetical protein